MNAKHYHYADRKFSVGDVYNMVEGYQQEITGIWLDNKYGNSFSVRMVGEKRHGSDTTPNDFYRRVISKV